MISILRIGVFDEETRYVTKLCTYLNRNSSGLWKVSAFTDKEALENYMMEKKPDMIIATEKKLLTDIMENYAVKVSVWLSGEKGKRSKGDKGQRLYSIYRYQSAQVIVDALRDIVEYIGLLSKTGKRNAVVYSPVGRCGKTSMCINYVKDNVHGKWLYIGMEDYSGDVADKNGLEDFVYYVKERNDERIAGIIASCGGIIPSSFSPFDTRLVDKEDIIWFLKVFENVMEYRGVLFDIGTGVLRDFDVLSVFENVIVPYNNDHMSHKKKKQFEMLLESYELNELKDRLCYLDMSIGDGQVKLGEILQ